MGSITFVIGPTASGKSKWALTQALQNNGLILNADSLQVFKMLDIGTAKPTNEEMALCPHQLFSFVEVGNDFTAGQYRRAALKVIESEISKHNIYIVGGSGFYIQALDKGMFDVEPIPESFSDQVENERVQVGNEQLWQELYLKDPESAQKIHVNDSYRIVRALSVVRYTGRAWSGMKKDFQNEGHGLSAKYPVKKIGLLVDKSELKKRIHKRAQVMLDSGWVSEVQSILKLAPPNWAPLQSVGYKEIMGYLSGQVKDNELLSAIVKSTEKLAKKQMTWFKRDPEIHWQVGE